MSNPYPHITTNAIFTKGNSMNKSHDPYASEEDSLALVRKQSRTDAEKVLDLMMDERGANEQGAEPYVVLRQIAIEMIEANR